MKRNQCLTDEKAKEQKLQGGFKIANFRDFAIYCNESYSLSLLREFKIEDANFDPVDIFNNFFEQMLIKESNHSGFILVYHGRKINRFVHAAAFIRYEINFRPYMMLLDSKNSEPLYHPVPPHKDFHPIEVWKDIHDERRTYFK